MYFMNSPTIPGQNSSGEKAATRVSVAAITGPAIRRAANAKASSRGRPSAIRRSANSVTMIASSTSIPTARIRLKSTTMLTVSPASDSRRMPIRNDTGIARPIRIAARPESANRMTMKTSTTAVSTLFCRSERSWRISVDLSWEKPSTAPSGITAPAASAAAFTPSTVWIRLAPVRLETSIAIAGWPFSRVIVSGSLKVARTVAMSRARTTASGPATTGRFATSSAVSISDGILMA